MKIAVIGAGWAGCAAAVEATRQGHQVSIYESARIPGGRARRVDTVRDGSSLAIDNGQHILIGAYTETLQLMTALGVDVARHFLRLPLRLQFPNGDGLALPATARRLPPALQAALGIVWARGWRWQDKVSLLHAALRWQAAGFKCDPTLTVAVLCHGLTSNAMAGLIEPLCVSALNTPPERASAQVFLRVMKDALFSATGGSDLLLPRDDLSALLPDAALRWLASRGPAPRLGVRVESLLQRPDGWQVKTAQNTGHDPFDSDSRFDAVLLACPALEAARLVEGCNLRHVASAQCWLGLARGLHYEALATVYAQVGAADRPVAGACLPQALLALPCSATEPAQFVFDRGQLGGPPGLLAFVVSASQGDKALISRQVLAQGQRLLGFPLEAVQTIVEKRATFACTPGLQRPGVQVAAGLLACGDYVQGPYPATLEGAVRSGLEAARLLTH